MLTKEEKKRHVDSITAKLDEVERLIAEVFMETFDKMDEADNPSDFIFYSGVHLSIDQLPEALIQALNKLNEFTILGLKNMVKENPDSLKQIADKLDAPLDRVQMIFGADITEPEEQQDEEKSPTWDFS